MQSGAVLCSCWRIAVSLWLERSEGAMRLGSLPAGLKQGQLVVSWHVNDILHLQGQFVPVKFRHPLPVAGLKISPSLVQGTPGG